VSVAIFFLLATIAAAIIAYPLLPGRAVAWPAPPVTDGDIERAVRDLRRSRSVGGLSCPACGQGYQAGDRFCVRCGGALSQPQAASSGLVCPSCGAAIHEGDRFCARCGHRMTAGEALT
jgi:predicted nucleic acid-binding Zn ribbon protein